MKFKYLVLPVFLFSSVTITYADDITTGKGGLGGGLGIYERMFFSSSLTKVQIIDSTTGLEIAVVLVEELDSVIDSLPSGVYLLIYTDSDGGVTEEIPLLKE